MIRMLKDRSEEGGNWWPNHWRNSVLRLKIRLEHKEEAERKRKTNEDRSSW